jgi:uncharacterized protein (DUF2235 family)
MHHQHSRGGGMKFLEAMKHLALSVRDFIPRHKKGLRMIERAVLWPCAALGLIAVIGLAVMIARPAEKGGNQSNFVGAEQQNKRLVVFLDGTWNSVDSNTNVWRMRALCASKGTDEKPQLVYYGIGVNGFLGGVFGQGLDENIRLAYEWLVENYNPGDEIYIFGFSRGAYTARALAGLITIDGILKPGSPIGVGELFKRYKDGTLNIWQLAERKEKGSIANLTTREEWLLKYSQPVEIQMVGVWDTVGSIGWKAGNIRGVSRSQFEYLQTGLRIHILNAYQALAIDEHRGDFAPTLWDKRLARNDKDVVAVPRSLSSVEQRWFVGAHANVGGGYEHDLLAQAPLRWMMKKAESRGLTFRSDVDLDGDALKAPLADSYKEFADGWYAKVSSPLYRAIGRAPEIREKGTYAVVNETVDASVFDRWRADPAYRPSNLVDWARRKEIDPAKVFTAVRADDPQTAVREE